MSTETISTSIYQDIFWTLFVLFKDTGFNFVVRNVP